ncbi:hypothetical protein PAQ31011_00657 [Pandoraea aquatica]|uniref:Uncharacterized protein n=1 Tax=Pandoraea aquatica TaxID=2508290 RepID=A0A5E4SBL1_9BURK|nr:hypothetical protein PAQ31011_00657 [Pandoraea aquatica]
MPMWKTRSVDTEPVTHLVRWRVFEASDFTRHFVGWAIEGMAGRVSSAIQEFDLARGEGRTRSGRVYRLEGPSGEDGDASYTWDRWCTLNAVVSTRDVSNEYREHVADEGRV